METKKNIKIRLVIIIPAVMVNNNNSYCFYCYEICYDDTREMDSA